jgi:hypothetical protein
MILTNLLHLVWDYLPVILPLGIYFLTRFILLSAALWILLRAQDLNYTIPGMLGSAALASAFDMIPFGGHYAAVGVLLFCVLKLTRAHFIDVRFTVAISYAVMFLMQMLLLTAMPGDLQVFARSPKVARVLQATTGGDNEADLAEMNAAPVVAKPIVSTNEVVQAPAPTNAAPAPKPVVAPAANPAPDLSHNFSLKGVMKSSGLVIINTGTKTYTVGLGETTAMDTAGGKVDVSVESIADTSAVIKIGGVPTTLQLR